METTVTNEVVDLDKLFPGMDTEDVLTSKVPNIFNNDKDLTFLDKTKEALEQEPGNTTTTENADTQVVPSVNEIEGAKILDAITKVEEEDNNTEVEAVGTAGRPKVEKNALTSYLKEKIEGGQFSAFEDWDDKKQSLDDYLSKQPEKVLHQMLDANWKAKETELLTNAPKELFGALPQSLQYVANAAMNGATENDLKYIYQALSRIEQVKELDPETESGQIAITRNYLQAKEFGTAEEIEEEITNWKETNRLEKKARELKPKLDQMEKEQLAYQLEQQEEWNKQQRAAAQIYVATVGQTLQKGEIDGIKLDKKTQMALYNGLVSNSFPTVAGKTTNLFGHLIDKMQYVEPNFELLADVTWHMMDPIGYKEAIRQQGANSTIKETVKQLKSQQGNSNGGFEVEDNDNNPAKKKLVKPRNMFEKV